MKSLIWISLLFTFSSGFASEFYPFVQTHTFQMEPYLKNAQGYAFFIASSEFTGVEMVTIRAPAGAVFPDINKNQRALSQYSNGMWYIPDAERSQSAMGGILPNGIYEYIISKGQETQKIQFNHKNSFLEPVTNIRVKDRGDQFYISWQSFQDGDTFWVFVFPADTNDILSDLNPVSSVMHRPTSHNLKKSALKPGRYKVAIRANRFWEGGTFWALDSEAWSISEEAFVIR